MIAGLDGPVVITTARVAAAIAPTVEALAREARRNGQRLDDEVATWLSEIRRVAHEHARRRLAPRSADVPSVAPERSAPAPSPVRDRLTTAEAARVLGCSERNVRALLHRDGLQGTKDERGRWWVDPGSIDDRRNRP